MEVAAPLLFWALFYAGPAFTLGLQASCAQTALKIWSEKSVGLLSIIPFVSLFASSLTWTYYGILAEDRVVLIPNAVGIVAGMFCMAIFESICPVSNLCIYCVLLLVVVFCTTCVIHGDQVSIGYTACVLYVCTLGAPLSTLGTVIRDRSTDSLPFGTSVMSWLNSSSWSLYGTFVADDPMIYIPSMIGWILSSVQMSLFLIFGISRTNARLIAVGKLTPTHENHSTRNNATGNRNKEIQSIKQNQGNLARKSAWRSPLVAKTASNSLLSLMDDDAAPHSMSSDSERKHPGYALLKSHLSPVPTPASTPTAEKNARYVRGQSHYRHTAEDAHAFNDPEVGQ